MSTPPSSDLLSLAGKTALVTGGASGLGYAIARTLGHHGARVVICDLESSGGAEIALTLNQAEGVDARFVSADISEPESVARAFAGIDRLDVLVNCAGIREIARAEDLSPAEWERVVSVNLNGTFYCVHQAIPLMKENGGSIVNVASVAGLIAMANRPAYSSTKHAIVGLTKNLAHDLGQYGIRVNAVAPGTIRTPLTEQYYHDPDFLDSIGSIVPLAVDGTAQDIANVALFLCSQLSAFVSGVVLPVDGGWLAQKNYSPTNTSAAYTGSGR